MPLSIQGSLFLASDLHLLLLFPLYKILRGEVIFVSETCKLLTQIHDILDNAMSKEIGNTACILMHIFNSVSGWCCEVWVSQFPFLHSPKDMVPPSEAYLYKLASSTGSAAVFHLLVSIFSS